MAKQAVLESVLREEPDVARLARFFPEAVPVHIPVEIRRAGRSGNSSGEKTVIQFGTPGGILFASSLPLQFEDRVRVMNADGSLDASAEIVAVQFHNRRTVVAARFLDAVPNWIIKAR